MTSFCSQRGEGVKKGPKIAVSVSNSDLMLLSNNDIILQSEGGGGQKGQKMRLYLMYGPLANRFTL